MSGQPYPKSLQVGAGRERRYRRKAAGELQWQRLRAQKVGPCRVCAHDSVIQLHHVVPRSSPWFGDDVADNLVPVCMTCHELIERRAEVMTGRGRRDRAAARKRPIAVELIVTLSDSEYAYAVQKCGEAFWERCYGVRYSR